MNHFRRQLCLVKGIFLLLCLHLTHHFLTTILGAVASEVTLLVARITGGALVVPLLTISRQMTGFVARVAGGGTRAGALAGYVARFVAIVAHILADRRTGAVSLQVARFTAVVAFLFITGTIFGDVTVVTTAIAVDVLVATAYPATATALVGAIFGDVSRATTLVASARVEGVSSILHAGAVARNVTNFTALVAVFAVGHGDVNIGTVSLEMASLPTPVTRTRHDWFLF